MSAERISQSPTFWPRQGLLDSLVCVLGNGESKRDTDPERDPFFEFEAWLVPEQSPLSPSIPDEEELAARLSQVPERLLEFLNQGLLTVDGYARVVAENGLSNLTVPEQTPAAAGESGGCFTSRGAWVVGQLAMINFRKPGVLETEIC